MHELNSWRKYFSPKGLYNSCRIKKKKFIGFILFLVGKFYLLWELFFSYGILVFKDKISHLLLSGTVLKVNKLTDWCQQVDNGIAINSLPVNRSPVDLLNCKPVYLSTCLPIYLLTHQPADSFSCLHVDIRTIDLSTCQLVYLSPVNLPIRVPVDLSIC